MLVGAGRSGHENTSIHPASLTHFFIVADARGEIQNDVNCFNQQCHKHFWLLWNLKAEQIYAYIDVEFLFRDVHSLIILKTDTENL